MKVTSEQVKAAALAAGIMRVDHHDCGGCGYMTAYLITPQGDLYFDPGCNCTYGYGPEPRSWEDAADWINLQSNPHWRNVIASRFGLYLQSEAEAGGGVGVEI